MTSGRCAAQEALEWIAYAADRGLRLGSEHGALLYTRTAARAALASPCCVSANSQEQVREALAPFADIRNWHHNYDGSGLVYTGPRANDTHGARDVSEQARAALALLGSPNEKED